ncbi:hypothetical protein E2C01_010693 [Portunus trituberculatus]|uniref:Uncharacterized protein n=1 Tax=Portunus trituberculatus TaxID=210409 RepID=A0A5B7D9F0_PORTR|nr:hypothetical protein [Portunus trituberculatus]
MSSTEAKVEWRHSKRNFNNVDFPIPLKAEMRVTCGSVPSHSVTRRMSRGRGKQGLHVHPLSRYKPGSDAQLTHVVIRLSQLITSFLYQAKFPAGEYLFIVLIHGGQWHGGIPDGVQLSGDGLLQSVYFSRHYRKYFSCLSDGLDKEIFEYFHFVQHFLGSQVQRVMCDFIPQGLDVVKEVLEGVCRRHPGRVYRFLQATQQLKQLVRQ